VPGVYFGFFGFFFFMSTVPVVETMHLTWSTFYSIVSRVETLLGAMELGASQYME
jgi:hypothetical protein